jgi:hypothetical protein
LAKEKARKIAADPAEQKRLTALFDACFRIQREAIEAAGRYIPMVVENVCGAQKWVGRAKWHFGSFYLWGDVPALMPITLRGLKGIPHSPGGHWTNPAENGEKVPGFRFDGSGKSFQSAAVEGVKQPGHSNRHWFADKDVAGHFSSQSPARKRASAMIAKIPLSLSRHIARTYRTSWIAVGLDRAVYGEGQHV